MRGPTTNARRRGEHGTRLRFWRAALLVFPGLFFLAVSSLASGEAPPDYRLITHPARPDTKIDREFVANAFLKNITRWPNDEAIRPVDQRADAGVRRRFSDSVLKRSVQAVKTYWQQRIFSGRGVPPPELESDEAIVRYVESNPGALGYISGTAAPGKTRVLLVTH